LDFSFDNVSQSWLKRWMLVFTPTFHLR
jgi:hypothetical protein